MPCSRFSGFAWSWMASNVVTQSNFSASAVASKSDKCHGFLLYRVIRAFGRRQAVPDRLA